MKKIALLLTFFFASNAWTQRGTKVELTLHPSGASIPALRYPLLPELRSRQPGNAAMLYYRAFSPEWNSIWRQRPRKEMDVWLGDMRKVPDESLSFVLKSSRLKEIDRASRRAYCDWERLARLREEGIMMLLPDAQGMREFGRAIACRARFELEKRDYRAAIRTLQTAFSMARDVGSAATLIEYMVGIAIARVMLVQVEVWISQPDSPNLYWPLTTLPVPFRRVKKGLDAERIWIDTIFPDFREMLYEGKLRAVSKTEARGLLKKSANLARALYVTSPKVNWFETVRASVYVAATYPSAMRTLMESGLKKESLEKLPMTQVVLMTEVLNYDRYFDEIRKWIQLPYPQARPHMQKAIRNFAKETKGGSRAVHLAKLLLPAVEKVFEAQVHFQRKIAALRCVEALRLHAHAHDGAYPEKLSELKVPIPIDPITGKPFIYERNGNQASIRGAAPDGERPHRSNSIDYQLTLK